MLQLRAERAAAAAGTGPVPPSAAAPRDRGVAVLKDTQANMAYDAGRERLAAKREEWDLLFGTRVATAPAELGDVESLEAEHQLGTSSAPGAEERASSASAQLETAGLRAAGARPAAGGSKRKAGRLRGAAAKKPKAAKAAKTAAKAAAKPARVGKAAAAPEVVVTAPLLWETIEAMAKGEGFETLTMRGAAAPHSVRCLAEMAQSVAAVCVQASGTSWPRASGYRQRS
jgi:hypothetical protein